MLRHHLILIYRNFKRFKSTFLINLIGLSTGLACVLMIYLWVHDELSVDKFHQKGSQLFVVLANHQNTNGIETWNGTPGLLAKALKEEIPGVQNAVSGTDPNWFGQVPLNVGENRVKALGQFASADFFNVFSYNLIQGNKNAVLSDKNNIVISKSLAAKLFGNKESVVGQTIGWQMGDYKNECVVSGVFEDVPANSSIQFDFVLSFDYFQDQMIKYPLWDNNYAITYLVLDKDVDIDQFNDKIAHFAKDKGGESNVTMFVTPYADYYLHGKYEDGKQAGGRIEYVRLFSAIAIFILLIACINFMNLSTAKASRKIKEVGIKKAIGAGRKALAFQYLGESMMMAFMSLLGAVLVVGFLLPQFNVITGKHLSLHFDVDLISAMVGICLFTGFVAGSYPALYLSGFRPAVVLRGNLNTTLGELWARKGLVIFQFSMSIILIVCVLVVYKQIQFVQTKNLGFDKDNIIYLSKEGNVAGHTQTFLSEAKKIPGVVDAAISNFHFGQIGTTYGISWKGKGPDDDVPIYEVSVGYGALEMLGIPIEEGRTFSRDFISDSTAVIFNEAAIKTMGLKDPLGAKIDHYSGEKHIIGVTKDFNVESLYHEIKPLMFKLEPDNANTIMLKLSAGKERETIAALRQFYQAYNPGFSFDYRFLDEDYQALYMAEQRVSDLSKYFAGLAIVISCLGLFGLAAFTAERRLKEIGIRKILGASIFGIVRLLSGDFTKMVLIATVVALPVSYWITARWLQGFAYKIPLAWWYFAGAGILSLLIAWFTIGLQTIKTARVNPTKCLRDD